MKSFLTLILALVVCLQQLNAQAPVTASSYKPVVIFYNSEWQVTKKEHASYSRIAYFPERLKDIENLNEPAFNGAVRDFYADGSPWAFGSYNQGKKWGAWSFYYPNGQLDCKGNFDDVWPVGKWDFWYPDGKPLMEVEFKDRKMFVLSFWNEAGEQTVKDGNGIYSLITQDEQDIKKKTEGAYKNGIQTGVWIYGPMDGPVEMQQNLSELRDPQNGNIVLGNRNKFTIKPEPDYLIRTENWEPATDVYNQDYPVIADVMRCKVEKITLLENKNATGNHYYKITQQLAETTDTLEFSVPIVYPEFDKSINAYISRHFKFPKELYDKNIEGLLVLQFTVKADGSIERPLILKSVHPLLDQLALKMVEEMPNWKPATRKGIPIDLDWALPIRIKGRTFTKGPDESNLSKWPVEKPRMYRNSNQRGGLN